MSELGDLMKKREKEKVVFDTRQKEAVNTEENVYKVAPREEFRPKNNIQVDYEKQRLDGAKMGGSTWRLTRDAEKLWQKNMQLGQERTKRATPFTLEILDMGEKHANDQYDDEKTEDLIKELEAVQFTPRMFSGANIRKNFETDLEMIKKYRELKSRMGEGGLGSDELTMRARNLTGIFELFEKRVTFFAMENRVTLDGKIIPDEAEPGAMTESEIARWLEMTTTGKKDEKRSSGKKDRLYRVIQEEKAGKGMLPETVLRMSEEERIASIPMLVMQTKKLRGEVDPEDNSDEMLKKRDALITLNLVLYLAQAEELAADHKAAGKEASKEESKINDALEDLKKLRQRRGMQ